MIIVNRINKSEPVDQRPSSRAPRGVGAATRPRDTRRRKGEFLLGHLRVSVVTTLTLLQLRNLVKPTLTVKTQSLRKSGRP